MSLFSFLVYVENRYTPKTNMEMNLKFSPFGERTNVFSKLKQCQGSTIDDQSFNTGIEFFVTFELPGVWVVPPPRMPVANEGLGWDPLVKM